MCLWLDDFRWGFSKDECGWMCQHTVKRRRQTPIEIEVGFQLGIIWLLSITPISLELKRRKERKSGSLTSSRGIWASQIKVNVSEGQLATYKCHNKFYPGISIYPQVTKRAYSPWSTNSPSLGGMSFRSRSICPLWSSWIERTRGCVTSPRNPRWTRCIGRGIKSKGFGMLILGGGWSALVRAADIILRFSFVLWGEKTIIAGSRV